MPLTNINSYYYCTVLFLDHWSQSTDYLGAIAAVKLAGDYTRAMLVEQRDLLAAYLAEREVLALATRQIAGQRDVTKQTLHERTAEFLRLARSYKLVLADPGIMNSLPRMPYITASSAKIIQVANAILSVWQQLDALTTVGLPHPFTLEGGFTQAQYTALRDALLLNTEQLITAQRASKTNRIEREALVMKQIKPRLVEYRSRILGMFSKTHLLVQTLPSVTRPRGSAPEAVVLTGQWNTAERKAVLSWDACAHPDLDHYEVRACIDTRYRVNDDTVVARVPKTDVTFATAHGLVAAGSEVHYKVYAVTKTDRERGSNTVKVIRPTPVDVPAAA
ncbi:MAG: hypothetical protein SFY80_04885 [Verrucomicrobiota bacterium]|nr:hypothetical protein [Verrucomicrobiota bacterium]